ncbi:MAG: nuclear transport factor 2 family protein [Cypionkella sp.]
MAYSDIAGTAASARVDINEPSDGQCFTDHFHLLKINGAWTILSKIFHAHPTA